MCKRIVIHLIFIGLELIVVPAVALVMGLGVIMSEATSSLVPALKAGLVMFFITFAGLLGVFGYQHFKRIGQPDFGGGRISWRSCGDIYVDPFIVDGSVSFSRPDYGIMYMPVICAVAGFNPVLVVRGG